MSNLSSAVGMEVTEKHAEHAPHHSESDSDIFSSFFTYGRPLVWIFGTINNAIAFAVFSRKSMRGSLNSFLFRCLALLEFLLVQEHIESVFALGGIDLTALHVWSCRIIYWIVLAAQLVAVWVLVAIGVERVVAVVFPHLAKSWCTVKKGKVYVAILSIGSLALNIPYLIYITTTHLYVPAYGRVVTNCNMPTSGDPFLMQLLAIIPLIHAILYSSLPFIVLLLLNLIIIIGLCRVQQQRATMHAEGTTTKSTLTGMTSMLISVSVVFLILTTPYSVFIIFAIAQGRLIVNLLYISYILQALNHSINLWLYCLTGTKFRKEFIAMIQCK